MDLPAKFLALLLLTAATLVAAPTKPAEPAHVALGEEITLADWIVPGKTVVVDFYSDYCPPCRPYTEPLKVLHTQRDDIVVVKVDINRFGVKGIDWKSPVAQQFALRSIPHFQVYGPDGKLQSEGKDARATVHALLEAVGAKL